MKNKTYHYLSLMLILALFQSYELYACTGIQLTTEENTFVHGRTLEFGVEIKLDLVMIPRNHSCVATTPLGAGLTYHTKYAALGAIAFDQLAIMDGINEKGLAIGTFYFPGYANYVDTTTQNQSKSLSPVDFSNWILTQFATIEEVKQALPEVMIAPTLFKEWGVYSPPFHYIVYDREGKSLVIEPINGKLIASENPLGVFTNSPTFDWHMTNLRNFINLTPFNTKSINVKGLKLSPFGQGSGMVGMPGDFTPPSRFVQAAIFSITAEPCKTTLEAVLQTFHILNQFDIPVGVARTVENEIVYTDRTLMTCVRDPQALKFYYKTYEDQTIKMADLKNFDWQSKVIKKMAIIGKQTIIDISLEMSTPERGLQK